MQAVIIVIVVKDSSAIDNIVFHIIVIFSTIENTKKDSTTVDSIMKDGTIINGITIDGTVKDVPQ